MWRCALTAAALLALGGRAPAQEASTLPPALEDRPARADPDAPPPPPPPPSPPPNPTGAGSDAPPLTAPVSPLRGLPINLPTAMRLANIRPLDIAAADAGVRQAAGLLTQARVLWVPNINGGVGYYHHDNANQNLFTAAPFVKSTNSLLVGGGPTLTVGAADAIFAPLAARRILGARVANVQAARNNSVFSVAQAYFGLQQARGRLDGAEATVARADRLLRLTRGLSPSLVAPLEINRAEAQALTLRLDLENARRDWRVASAQLAEVLLLDPIVLLEPLEPPFLQVTLIPSDEAPERLVPLALGNRPELFSQREVLGAARMNLRREQTRPFIPNVIVSSPGTVNAGYLGAGQFYGGSGSGPLHQGGSREDFTVAAVWQLQNGGLGNVGLIRQRRAEQDQAAIDLSRVRIRIVSEVSQALARLQTARARVPHATEGLRQAMESADKNFIGLSETARPAGELLNLIVRPQEVVAAIIQLEAAYQQYYGAVNDYNTAQFELYRALGQPAQWVASRVGPTPAAPPASGALPPGATPIPEAVAPAAGPGRRAGR